MNVNHHKKKVCFVSSSLSNGGAERALSNLLCNMDLSELDVSLVLLNKKITYPIPEDINVIDLHKRSAIYLPLCFILLMVNLMKIKPDIVISVWSFPSLLTGIALKLTRLKSKWIVRVANNPSDQEMGLKKRFFYWLYQHATRYIVLCDELKESFEQHYPFAKGRTHLIRNGFNIADLYEKASEQLDDHIPPPYMISVGSLSQQKRYDVLLNAYALIPIEKRIPLVILGDGPLKNELLSLCKELDIESSVIFKGFVKNPYPYVINADIFTLASDYEGLCNAAIEAQCLGIPAVITNCPTGNKEIVEDGVTGYLVPLRNAEIMAVKISQLLNDNQNRIQMSENAKTLISKKYQIETSVEQLESLLLQLT